MQIAWPSAWKVGPPIGVRPGSVHSAHDRRDVLEPVVIRYRYRRLRRYFRGDAAFALPDIHEFPEADGYTYATRLKANGPLQACISHPLTRAVGGPLNHVRRTCPSFRYQAGSWDRKRRVVAKVDRSEERRVGKECVSTFRPR